MSECLAPDLFIESARLRPLIRDPRNLIGLIPAKGTRVIYRHRHGLPLAGALPYRPPSLLPPSSRQATFPTQHTGRNLLCLTLIHRAPVKRNAKPPSSLSTRCKAWLSQTHAASTCSLISILLSSITSRATACSSVSPTSTKPASTVWMPPRWRTCCASRI